jgi:hypothetical protein
MFRICGEIAANFGRATKKPVKNERKRQSQDNYAENLNAPFTTRELQGLQPTLMAKFKS